MSALINLAHVHLSHLSHLSHPVVLSCQFSLVPSDYNDVYLEMARRGARVLALGYKTLGVLSHQQVSASRVPHVTVSTNMQCITSMWKEIWVISYNYQI